MAKVTFVAHDLSENVIDGQEGQSVMLTAVGANVPGVVCGVRRQHGVRNVSCLR
jgi:ferredoxin